MSNIKSLEDILNGHHHVQETYSTDQKKRWARSTKGVYAKANFDFINLIKSWEQIVGPLLAQNTIPQKISYGALIIATKHAVFANELQMISPQIIVKIEQYFPKLKGKIKKIKFFHSEYNSKLFNKNKETNFTEQKSDELHPYSPEYKAKVKKAKALFNDIEDNEIVESLIKYMVKI